MKVFSSRSKREGIKGISSEQLKKMAVLDPAAMYGLRQDVLVAEGMHKAVKAWATEVLKGTQFKYPPDAPKPGVPVSEKTGKAIQDMVATVHRIYYYLGSEYNKALKESQEAAAKATAAPAKPAATSIPPPAASSFHQFFKLAQADEEFKLEGEAPKEVESIASIKTILAWTDSVEAAYKGIPAAFRVGNEVTLGGERKLLLARPHIDLINNVGISVAKWKTYLEGELKAASQALAG